MHVGIVATAEPLALDATSRAFRCGMLAEALVGAGHRATWWISSFDHVKKVYRRPASPLSGLDFRFLEGRPYWKNVSVSRLLHNRDTAVGLSRDLARRDPEVDAFFVCIPTHELASATLDFAASRSVPTILDARDPWPDVYLSRFPRALRPAAQIALLPSFRSARDNFRRASAITAVSETYLTWALSYAGRARDARDRVFPIGIPRDRMAEQAPAEPPHALRVVFAGSFVASADLKTVVRAAQDLQHRGADVEFILAGDGDGFDRVRSEVAGMRSVLLPGWLPENQLLPLLRSCDLGLAPYRKGAVQSLPNKPFEYWSAGLPVLECLGGELGTLVCDEGVGLSYDAGDPRSLVRSLEWALLHRDDLRAMGERALRMMTRQFDSAVIYRSLVEFIEHIAAQH